jgi:hypothetical protein
MRPRPGVIMPLDTVRSPGAYVCDWDGNLLRLSRDGVQDSRSRMNFVGLAPLTVTMISADPHVPLETARGLAKELGARVSF